MKILFEGIVKVSLGIILVGLLIFLPAGTLNFWQGWLLMAILFLPMLAAGVVMAVKSPALLKSRLDAKEKQKDQSLVVKLSGLMFIAGFVTAGFNHRFAWYTLPDWVSVVGAVLFLSAYLLYAEVLRENAYLSRTIQVQANQKVVDTGLYGIVRHPMYASTLILFLSMPIVLGSIFALPIFFVYPFLIAKRIGGEEKFLEKELNGYQAYKQKVKYRLIPFIW